MRPDPHARKNNKVNNPMKNQSVKPEIAGTRSGYVIRFTCPLCNAENSIVNKTPRDHYKLTRDAACSRCRKRMYRDNTCNDAEPGIFSVARKITGDKIIT